MQKYNSLHTAYMKYAEERVQEAYEEFLFNFFLFTKDGCNVHVPVSIDANGRINYGLVNTTDGYYYSVCTNADELCRCPDDSSAVVALDKLLVHMLHDKNIKGICINPYGDFPCFIPQQYAKHIIAEAEK